MIRWFTDFFFIFFISILLPGLFLSPGIAYGYEVDSSRFALPACILPYSKPVNIIQELIDGQMAYIAYGETLTLEQARRIIPLS